MCGTYLSSIIGKYFRDFEQCIINHFTHYIIIYYASMSTCIIYLYIFKAFRSCFIGLPKSGLVEISHICSVRCTVVVSVDPKHSTNKGYRMWKPGRYYSASPVFSFTIPNITDFRDDYKGLFYLKRKLCIIRDRDKR